MKFSCCEKTNVAPNHFGNIHYLFLKVVHDHDNTSRKTEM